MESSDQYNGRRALASEMAQLLDMARQLEAHVGESTAAAREHCRVLASGIRSSIDRSIDMARSCSAEARPGPASPRSVDGSPRSSAGDARCHGGVRHCKKRKGMPKWNKQVRVSSVQDVGPLDDGFSWRKYGQKDILGAKYPRAYFRCTYRPTQECYASKQVQRTDGDPLLFDVVYHGEHTCVQGAQVTQRTPSPGGAERLPRPSHEQSILAVKTEGARALEAVVVPVSFPSVPTVGADGSGTISGRFTSCFGACVSPATSGCQAGGGEFAAGGAMGVHCVLPSTTNSPMGDGDMDFMLQLNGDFLDTYADFYSV